MNVKHMSLGNDLGLTLEGYVKMGLQEAMKNVCILCGEEPIKAGVCIADSANGMKMMGTPAGQHRFAFFALCETCQYDPDMDEKVRSKVLQAVKK